MGLPVTGRRLPVLRAWKILGRDRHVTVAAVAGAASGPFGGLPRASAGGRGSGFPGPVEEKF
jgi:hypothetical protein